MEDETIDGDKLCFPKIYHESPKVKYLLNLQAMCCSVVTLQLSCWPQAHNCVLSNSARESYLQGLTVWRERELPMRSDSAREYYL